MAYDPTDIPVDFDPLTARDEELDRYNLPRRPNAELQPGLLKAWLRLFERPFTLTRSESILVDDLIFIRRPQMVQSFMLRTRIETSGNWAGASIVPHDGDQFVVIVGEWTVPAPSLPPPDRRGPAGQQNVYVCSTFIGLDGNRLYENSSLPQVGTAQTLTVAANNSQAASSAVWFQWWARDQTALNLMTFPGITVTAGTDVMAWIWAIDPLHVVVLFRTFGTNPQFLWPPHVAVSPDVKLKNGIITKPTISGATAGGYWNVRRSSRLARPILSCFRIMARSRSATALPVYARQPGFPTGEEILTGAHYLRMYDVPGVAPPRSRLISMPRRVSTTSVAVDYGGF